MKYSPDKIKHSPDKIEMFFALLGHCIIAFVVNSQQWFASFSQQPGKLFNLYTEVFQQTVESVTVHALNFPTKKLFYHFYFRTPFLM